MPVTEVDAPSFGFRFGAKATIWLVTARLAGL
jgi:hypothetical protein